MNDLKKYTTDIMTVSELFQLLLKNNISLTIEDSHLKAPGLRLVLRQQVKGIDVKALAYCITDINIQSQTLCSYTVRELINQIKNDFKND